MMALKYSKLCSLAINYEKVPAVHLLTSTIATLTEKVQTKDN